MDQCSLYGGARRTVAGYHWLIPDCVHGFEIFHVRQIDRTRDLSLPASPGRRSTCASASRIWTAMSCVASAGTWPAGYTAPLQTAASESVFPTCKRLISIFLNAVHHAMYIPKPTQCLSALYFTGRKRLKTLWGRSLQIFMYESGPLDGSLPSYTACLLLIRFILMP
jgi:hypothetical protein